MSSMTGGKGYTGSLTPLKNTGYDMVSTLSPDKQNIMQMLMSGNVPGMNKLSQLAGGGDEEMWKQIEAPALRQFGELQGQIASRFSGAGMGARRSSGFQNAQSGAATDLAERLQSNRLGLQQNATQSLMDLYKSLLGIEDTALTPKKKKWWEELLPAFSEGVGKGVGMAPMMLL